MIWLAYFMLFLESLVIAISLWMMWAMVSGASREPPDRISEVQPPERQRAHSLEHQQEAGDSSALFTLGEIDERGYLSSRKLHMGCEAAVCRIPSGARIVAGRRSLREPQYAWDYASVQLAHKALAYAELNTDLREGIIGVEDLERGSFPAAEPKEYLRRWRYTAEGRMERF